MYDEAWEFQFRIEGLALWNEVHVENCILIRPNNPAQWRSMAWVRLPAQGNQFETIPKAKNILRQFLQLYMLISSQLAERKAKRPSPAIFHTGISPVSASTPIGTSPFVDVISNPSPPLQHIQLALVQAVNGYPTLSKMLAKPEFQYLLLAIDYYYQGINTPRLEAELVNYIIALEALFLRRNDKKGEILSKRTATLLSSDKWFYDYEILHDIIRKLYNVRCDIVHGSKQVTIDIVDMIFLRKITAHALKLLIGLGYAKDELLDLINQAESENEATTLIHKIESARTRWYQVLVDK